MPGNIYSKIDSVWEQMRVEEDFTSISIIDLFTYIIFLKHLDERQSLEERKATLLKQRLQNSLYPSDLQELRWKNIVAAEPSKLHELFSGPVHTLVEQHRGNESANIFIKTAELNVPSAGILSDSVKLVDQLDLSLPNGEEDFYAYLVTKARYEEKAKQQIIPQHIAATVAELAEPKTTDVVYDPCAGRCELLLACADYVNHANTGGQLVAPENLIGVEDNPSLARLGNVSLSLKSGARVELQQQNILSNSDLFPREASVVVANLLFSEPFYEGPVDKEALSIDSKKRELLYLKLILRKLEQSARAVLLVSDNMLKENGSLLENEIKSEIVDQCRLDAVVSLPPNSISNTSKNAAILVFSKEAVTTEHPVFFYHIHDDGVSGGTDKKKIRKLANAPLMFPDDYGDIPDLFNQWKVCKREYTCEPTSQSMLVPSAEIRERNYSLNIRSFLKQDDKKPASVVTQNRQAFPANRPASTRSTSMRWVPIAALFLLAIAAAFYFLRKDDKGSKVATNTFSGGDTAGSVNASEDTQRIKTPESTKKVKDTLIRISPAEVPPVQPPVATTSSPKQAEKRSEETTEKVSEEAAEKQPKTEATTTRTSIDANAAKGEYKIINKAYFHNEPDESTRRNAFVVHWNNSYATLKALDEKNGFIYVVFKNNLGQVSKGWLKKDDLRRINEEKQ